MCLCHSFGSVEEMLIAAIDQVPVSMCLVDMNVPGLPQLHVNSAYELLTGFSKNEAIGKNCRLLQVHAPHISFHSSHSFPMQPLVACSFIA